MNAAAVFPELEGRVVKGRFRLDHYLGGSEQSHVYATEVGGNPLRKAAIKLIPASAPGAEGRLSGWLAAAQLSHPNLIGVVDCGRYEIDGNRFIYQVTDRAEEVLAEVLRERPLTAEETQAMLGPVLDALDYLRQKGFAHGRLKPSNILVADEWLKLSADCVSVTAGNGARQGQRGTFDAPELSEGTVSAAVDVWSLGMTLVAAITQRAPASVDAVTGEPEVPVSVPEPFAGIARDCLRIDPARRCTLKELSARLVPGRAPQVAKQDASAPARSGSSKKLLIAAAVLLLAVAAVVATVRPWQGKTKNAEQQTSPAAESHEGLAKPSPSKRSGQTEEAQPATVALPAVSPGNGGAGVVNRVIPVVLPAAQQSINGHVDVGVRVTVDGGGNVSDAALENPSGSNYFNRVSMDAARQWKFAAGQAGMWKVRFEFRQDGIDAGARPE